MTSWLDPYKWLLWGAFVIALLVGGYALVDHIGDVREAKVRAEYKKQTDAVDAKREKITAPIEQKAQAAQEKIKTVYKTITKKVPIYVKATDCPMSGGFRVLHDAAANGKVPDATSIPNAAPAPAQDVADTVVSNYESCTANAQKLTDLQGWVKAQKSLE